MRLERHEFQASDLVGGNPALDLVNTVTGRDQEARDWLVSYPALIQLLMDRNVRDERIKHVNPKFLAGSALADGLGVSTRLTRLPSSRAPGPPVFLASGRRDTSALVQTPM